jgi:hypothetical protein
MAKQQIVTDSLSVRTLGEWLGQAIGEGISEGASRAMGDGEPTFQPLVNEIVEVLRRELQASVAEAALQAVAAADSEYESDELAEIARAESTRPCIEDGCTESAVSRNLCRKHYARKLYQERRERIGAHGFRVVQPRTLGSYGGETVAQSKPLVAAVAPIIRRKRTDGAETPAPAVTTPVAATPIPAPAFKAPAFDFTPNPIAAAAAKSGVTPESVARALGLLKE